MLPASAERAASLFTYIHLGVLVASPSAPSLSLQCARVQTLLNTHSKARKILCGICLGQCKGPSHQTFAVRFFICAAKVRRVNAV